MVPPLIRQNLTVLPSRRQATAPAISGEPVFPYCTFRKAAPGGIWARCTAASHHPATLLNTLRTYFFPSTRSYEAVCILTKCNEFVKHPCKLFSFLNQIGYGKYGCFYAQRSQEKIENHSSNLQEADCHSELYCTDCSTNHSKN